MSAELTMSNRAAYALDLIATTTLTLQAYQKALSQMSPSQARSMLDASKENIRRVGGILSSNALTPYDVGGDVLASWQEARDAEKDALLKMSQYLDSCAKVVN